MTADRETMYSGLSKAAWGYFFLNIDINLGTVSILPQFAGYLLLLAAIGCLENARRDLGLLRPLCFVMAVWTFGDWVMSWGGADLDGRFLFLDLLTSAAALYFHFQFLTDMAALAEQFQPPGDILDSTIRTRRNIYVVAITLLALLMYLPLDFMGDARDWIIMGTALVGCIAAVSVMFAQFSLRRCVKNALDAYES